jgi:hypothetical protein
VASMMNNIYIITFNHIFFIQVQIDDDLRPKIESKLDQKDLLLLERETIIHEISTLEKELLLKASN